MASAQLELISSHSDWKLDRETIEVGRVGIAKARAALELANERAEAAAKAMSVADTAQAVKGQGSAILVAASERQTVTQLVIELPDLALAA